MSHHLHTFSFVCVCVCILHSVYCSGKWGNRWVKLRYGVLTSDTSARRRETKFHCSWLELFFIPVGGLLFVEWSRHHWRKNNPCHGVTYKSFKEIKVPIFIIAVSLAALGHVTVIKGHTLHLTCPLTNAHKTSVEWRNPDGNLMFFNRKEGEDGKSCTSHTNRSIIRHSRWQNYSQLLDLSGVKYCFFFFSSSTGQKIQHQQAISFRVLHQRFKCHLQRWRHLHGI